MPLLREIHTKVLEFVLKYYNADENFIRSLVEAQLAIHLPVMPATLDFTHTIYTGRYYNGKIESLGIIPDSPFLAREISCGDYAEN